MRPRGGKWSGRPNLGQIEEQAVQKISEFRHKLQAAGLSVPEIPPVPVEYIALTITELGVRGVSNLTYEGKSLSGLLDMERGEILYEEHDPPGRQNFTVAHELGHYFLHYLPAMVQAQQPTLFDTLDFPILDPLHLERAEPPSARFFRCMDTVVTPDSSEEASAEPALSARSLDRRDLENPTSKAQLAKIIRLKEVADRTEWEANIFARGLLMPSDLVRWLNKKYLGEVSAMAAELTVTPTALRYRLNGLGLRQDENMGMTSSNTTRQKSDPPAAEQGTFF